MEKIFNFFKLNFTDEELENEFQIYYWDRFVKSIRHAFILGIFLYALFSLLDIYLYPDFKYKLVRIRFLFVIPVLSIVYFLLGNRKNIKYLQLLVFIGLMSANFGIIEMIRIINTYNCDKNIYFSGLLLSAFFAYAFFRMKFIWAVMSGLLTIAGYEFMIIWVNNIFFKDIVASNFFFIPFHITGMMFSYALETDSRNYFLLLKKLEKEKGILKNVNIKLDKLAHLDGLTEIANKRFLIEKLKSLWIYHKNSKETLSLIMIDVDFFKNYNDFYGHIEGDNVLKIIARELVTLTRKDKDIVGRFGGEEFMIILPETDEKKAFEIAERVRTRIMALKILHETSNVIPYVTVSVGVASIIPDDNDFEKILEITDKMLYRAKETGRNKVCSASMIS